MKYVGLVLALLFIALAPMHIYATALPANGEYTVEVALSGGSGRASVQSPTTIAVEDGAVTAIVTWSSAHYEHMLVDGILYYPVSTQENAVFEIPVTLDTEMAVSAQTIAMSEPHEIDYVLYFDSATVKPLRGVRSPLPVAAVALAVLLGAAFLLARARKTKMRRGDGA